MLAFRGLPDRELTTLPIAEIEQVVAVTRGEEYWHELVVTHQGRMRVDIGVLYVSYGNKPPRQLKDALRHVNRGIQFLERDGQRCHECHADLGWQVKRCQGCGAHIPEEGRFV